MLSQRWISPFNAAKSMEKSVSAGGRRPYGVLSSFSQRQLHFDTEQQGRTQRRQIASQVLHSIQERSEGKHNNQDIDAIGTSGAANQKDYSVLSKQVDGLESRLRRLQQSVERILRGVSKYTIETAGAMERREKDVIDSVTEAVTAAVAEAVTKALRRVDHQEGHAPMECGIHCKRSHKRVRQEEHVSAPSCESCSSHR